MRIQPDAVERVPRLDSELLGVAEGLVVDHPQGISLDDLSPLQIARALDKPVYLADLMGDVLDALSGRIKWIIRYPYHTSQHDATQKVGWYRDPELWSQQKPIIWGDMLIVAPMDSFYLMALDRATGKVLWTAEGNGKWGIEQGMCYSTEHDVLLTRSRTDGIHAYRGTDGNLLWHNDKYREYDGLPPAIIQGQTVYTKTTAIDLLTGEQRKRTDPVTGTETPWTYGRGYGPGCGYAAASDHLLMFRSGSTGFFDLEHDSGKGSFSGFRPACSHNVIAADGVLNAPLFATSCYCNFQNQTSLALLHMPQNDSWTRLTYAAGKGPVKRFGLNFGAPGDRVTADGTLWFEFPVVAGLSADVQVKTQPETVKTFRRHSSTVGGEDAPAWIAASGLIGIKSLTVALVPGDADVPERTFRVVLHFLEPDRTVKRGTRVFDVYLQDKKVITKLDVVKAADGPWRAVTRTFPEVQAGRELTVRFTPVKGIPVISGIEIVAH